MEVLLDTSSIADYRKFLEIKRLPTCAFRGRVATFPDEYAERLGMARPPDRQADYRPIRGLFDYQRDIAAMAIAKRKFAVFADCGLGKTLILLEFARAAQMSMGPSRRVLIVSPLMVVRQTMEVVSRFYGSGGMDMGIEQVRAKDLGRWTGQVGSAIGITNYEAISDDVRQGRLGAMILDESSMLKSHYGKWGQQCIRLGAGLDWKLALTGTPAPNDRIEYANHAVFLDEFPTVNSFLARYFINRGEVENRWEIKPHAVGPFYLSLSHWSIFLTNPATYGWKDNTENIPPIEVTIHDVSMTAEQKSLVGEKMGMLFAHHVGGITSRATLGQIAKGSHKGRRIETNKPAFIRALVDSWPSESTIIWCLYNDEQGLMERTFPEAGSITGATPLEERLRIIDDFQHGRIRVLISKPKILGFGLNLQVATRQVFSGLQDSYESFYQAVKRSNRYGSTVPLRVHIPTTDVERPMIDTVLQKASRVQQDTETQERLFKESSRYGK